MTRFDQLLHIIRREYKVRVFFSKSQDRGGVFAAQQKPYITLYCHRTTRNLMLSCLMHEFGHYLSYQENKRHFYLQGNARARDYDGRATKRDLRLILQEELRAWRLGERFVYQRFGWCLNERQLQRKKRALASYEYS
jgi:hypothetical protein